jgi:hypothetical protein
LPSGENIDHHRTVKYVEAEVDAPAARQFTAVWAADGSSVAVTGPCPACGGRTATEFSTGIGGSKGLRGPNRHAAYKLQSPVTLFCECGHAHDDRPADALDRGCGRFWLVDLPDEALRPPVITAKP